MSDRLAAYIGELIAHEPCRGTGWFGELPVGHDKCDGPHTVIDKVGEWMDRRVDPLEERREP